MPTDGDKLAAELSEPLTLACGQVLPNRLMKAALSEGSGTRAHGPDERIQRLYTLWGSGGYGLVVTGNVMVDRSHLGETSNVLIEDDRDLDALTRWAKATKEGGCPIWMQINHPGRQANSFATRTQTVAPSAIASNIPGIPTPRALSECEIEGIVDRFATAAAVAEASGFGGVQIHGDHGYLVSQFLSAMSNTRTDRWGGDLDGRMRFVLEVVRAIRVAVSPGFALGIKLDSADFQRGGFSVDEVRRTVECLAAEQIDLIEISGGSYESPAMMGRPVSRTTSSTQRREAYFVDCARTARDAAGEVPLAVTGGFRTRSAMIGALRRGECDIIGLGRPPAVDTASAGALIDGAAKLETPRITLGLPARFTSSNSLDGAVDLQWHTDQLHRIGAGQASNPPRSVWRTAGTILERNSLGAFHRRRSTRNTIASASARKFRQERLIGRYVANPVVAMLTRLGVRVAIMTDIETTGRKTGKTRRVPVSASFDDAGAWLISQHGTRSGWGANITADSTVSLRVGGTWRTGTAEFDADDDVYARARTFAENPYLAKLVGATFRALQTTPISVRVTFAEV